ncbi:50S ribosomal protein L25/general stress protein Ctc [Kribbia dieselivorans]|uniref:50S ribosomal protein L25/general stress protein Ctc n=1 Tax=Kribbia dieselivorans TaxID=331526 RepID=UPI000838FF1C|nr:50S ribosomal protein L25/general stress protein Ctc [Kribbia dieselivorans]
MSDEILIKAEARTEFGKGAARRARRAGKVPAVIYGHGAEPIHVSLPGHDAMMALKQANALLTIELDGTKQLALAKDVQRDPIKPVIEHIDLVTVKRGEKVVVDIPVHVEGQAGPDTIVQLDAPTLSVEAEATHLPESITVSVEGLAAGTQITAGEVTLPQGSALAVDADLLVVNVTAQISAEALEADLAESEGGAEEAPAAEEASESE